MLLAHLHPHLFLKVLYLLLELGHSGHLLASEDDLFDKDSWFNEFWEV
jgi:hypothetical protein